MAVETYPTTDGLQVSVVSNLPATDQLDGDWVCDICSTPEALVRLNLGTKDDTYEHRVCSADPAHVKLVPVT